MDHPNQNTMLLPASYAVISEEEMTYLDGGQSIYLGSAFNHDIYFNTDQFATFCQNAAINLFVLMTNYSFRYIAGRVQSGLSNGLSLSGTFYHTWDKMNTWSRIASVGVAGLAGVYVYSQVMNVIHFCFRRRAAQHFRRRAAGRCVGSFLQQSASGRSFL